MPPSDSDLFDQAIEETAGLKREFIDQAGRSFSQYKILKTLSQATDGMLNKTEVSHLTDIDHGAIQKSTDKLVKAGLVVENRPKVDRREKLLKITTGGQTEVDRLIKITEQLWKNHNG